MGDEQLIRLLNSFTPSQYADFLSRSPVTLDYVNKIGYQHPSVMKSNQAYAMQNQPVTSNLGMSSNQVGSYGPNKPSYLHLDQAKHSGKSIPLSEYGNRPGGASIPFKESTAGQGTPMSFGDPSIAGTPQSMTDFYARTYPEARSGMPGYRVVGDPALQGVSTQSNYYGADPALTEASDQAVADSISGADAGGMSNLQSAGMYYGANVATDALINTHDRKKVDTPFGNKGSQGGIVKGGVKGALLGAQLSGGNPYATAGGAVVGALAGTQGGFDTETPPSYQVVGVRRRGGGGGLLAPKGMYG